MRIRLSPSRRYGIACRQSWKCNICQELFKSVAFQIDHITPLHLGGVNVESNLQALCANCHAVKTLREAQELEEAKRTRSKYFDPQSKYCLA